MSAETIRNCKICDKPTKTGCSRCKSVFYCSQDCQVLNPFFWIFFGCSVFFLTPLTCIFVFVFFFLFFFKQGLSCSCIQTSWKQIIVMAKMPCSYFGFMNPNTNFLNCNWRDRLQIGRIMRRSVPKPGANKKHSRRKLLMQQQQPCIVLTSRSTGCVFTFQASLNTLFARLGLWCLAVHFFFALNCLRLCCWLSETAISRHFSALSTSRQGLEYER